MTEAEQFDLAEALHKLGFREFRPGQQQAIETLLDRRRLLLVAPTGGGKSLSYQLPAASLPGMALVISPLISLMHDQVAALKERGVAATYLAATLEPDETRRRIAAAAHGAYKLIYVAPERLGDPGFRAMVTNLDCSLIAIDEAHCISQWGHDFRPEYLRLGDLVEQLSGSLVLACTATATPVVRDEILERLAFRSHQPVDLDSRHLYAPVGLDLGAEGAAQIALEICAQIQQVWSKVGQCSGDSSLPRTTGRPVALARTFPPDCAAG